MHHELGAAAVPQPHPAGDVEHLADAQRRLERADLVREASAAGVARPADASGLPTEAARTAAARSFHLERLDEDRVLEWHLRE